MPDDGTQLELVARRLLPELTAAVLVGAHSPAGGKWVLRELTRRVGLDPEHLPTARALTQIQSHANDLGLHQFTYDPPVEPWVARLFRVVKEIA